MSHTYIHTQARTHTHTNTHTHTQTHTHTHTHRRKHTHTHRHRHKRADTHTHTHTHARSDTQRYTHTHTHTHTRERERERERERQEKGEREKERDRYFIVERFIAFAQRFVGLLSQARGEARRRRGKEEGRRDGGTRQVESERKGEENKSIPGQYTLLGWKNSVLPFGLSFLFSCLFFILFSFLFSSQSRCCSTLSGRVARSTLSPLAPAPRTSSLRAMSVRFQRLEINRLMAVAGVFSLDWTPVQASSQDRRNASLHSIKKLLQAQVRRRTLSTLKPKAFVCRQCAAPSEDPTIYNLQSTLIYCCVYLTELSAAGVWCCRSTLLG